MRSFAVRVTDSPIEDVFVYRSELYCWTFSGKLRVYQISDIEAAIHQADPSRGEAMSYGLFHSKGFGASPHQMDRWRTLPDTEFSPHDPVAIDGESLRYEEFRTSAEGQALYDLLLFYDRLFLGTEDGLFSLAAPEIGTNGDVYRMDRSVREPCIALSAGLGAVAASCGTKGLRLLTESYKPSNATVRGTKVATTSVRADLGYGSVVNFRSNSEAEVLAGETRETNRGPALVSVAHSDAGSARSDFEQQDDGSEDGYVIWDHGRLVSFGRASALATSVRRSDGNRSLGRTKTVANYSDQFGPILSVVRTGRSFVLEGPDSLRFSAPHASFDLRTSGTISLRSYPHSHRYRRLVTATTETGLWLIGLDDHGVSGDEGDIGTP